MMPRPAWQQPPLSLRIAAVWMPWTTVGRFGRPLRSIVRHHFLARNAPGRECW